MKKSIIFFPVILVLISFSLLTAQSPGWWPNCQGRSYNMNLTPDQVKSLENLYQSFIKKINPLQNRLTSESLALRSMYFKSTLKKAAIIAKQKEMANLQQRLQEEITNYRLDALEILTTEQILLLPSDCCLGFNFNNGYGLGWRGSFRYDREFGRRFRYGTGYGYGRGLGRAAGRGRGRGFYNGRGRQSGYCPFWWPRYSSTVSIQGN